MAGTRSSSSLARRPPATVFFAGVETARPEADASLPAKFKRLLSRFDLARLCGNDWVPIKMHLGGGLGYTTLHPLFVRTVVQAVKDAGGKPFIVEGHFDALRTAHERGYTTETLGCPLVAAGGPYSTHVIRRPIGYKTLDEVGIYGAIYDAPCLINLAHVKGHGACGHGGACKNLAMGCVDGPSRGQLHALEGGIAWDQARCTFCGRCVKACDRDAISMDREEQCVRIFFHNCRYCRHCVAACPRKALKVTERNGFRHFQEGMARATRAILEHIPGERALHVNVLLNMTMFCDCWGFSSPSVVPDIGILASHDLVAVEKAALDAVHIDRFIPGTLIGGRKLGPGRHLWERVHGKDPFVQVRALERQGLGTSRYTLVPVD